MSPSEQRIAQARSQWRNGDIAGAEWTLREIVDRADSDTAPHAACVLGLLLYEDQQFSQAKEMYQRGIDSGHPIHAQRAALALGMLFTDEQELTAASPILQFAGDGADPDVAGRAHALLAQVLYLLGDLPGAHAAKERALTCSDPDVVAMATEQRLPALGGGSPAEDYLEVAYDQAWSLLEEERFDEAKPVLVRLVNSGHPDFGSLAAFQLCSIYASEGDLAAARSAAEHIIAFEHPDHVGRGHSFLGDVLRDLGDQRAAVDAYQRAAQDPRPDVRLHALVQLGQELRGIGESGRARETFQRVVNTGHKHYAVEALGALAELNRDEGDVDGAISAFGRVARSGHSDKAPRAAYNLGVLLHERGQILDSRAAFLRASESDDPELVRHATDALTLIAAEATAAQAPPPVQAAEVTAVEEQSGPAEHSGPGESSGAEESSGTDESWKAEPSWGLEEFWRSVEHDSGSAGAGAAGASRGRRATEPVRLPRGDQLPGGGTPPEKTPATPETPAEFAPSEVSAAEETPESATPGAQALRELDASPVLGEDAAPDASGHEEVPDPRGDHAVALESAGEPERREQEARQLSDEAAQAVEDGDADTARTTLNRIVSLAVPTRSALAGISLGLLEAALGRPEAARSAWQRAASDPQPTLAHDAAFLLVLLDEPAGAGHVLLRARFQRQYHRQRGDAMLDDAIRSADPVVGELAATLRAELDGSDDVEGAVERLSVLAASDHPLVVARAGFALAALLEENDRRAEVLGHAVRHGHPALAPWSAALLGELLMAQEAFDSARQALEAAVSGDNPAILSAVFGSLTMFYTAMADFASLESLCRRALAGSDGETAAQAAFVLGAERVRGEQLETALELFEQAANSNTTVARLGAFAGYALRHELDRAQAEFERAAAEEHSGQHYTATRLCLDLAHKHLPRGDGEFTEWALRLAIDSGHAELEQEAWLYLGVLRNDSHDGEAALAAWQHAAGGRDPELAATALNAVAALHRELGRLESAAAALDTIARGRSREAGNAAYELAVLRSEQGATSAAIAAFERTEELASGVTAADSARNLGRLLAETGDVQGARNAFERAIGAGDRYVGALSALNLGNALRDAGEAADAETAYARALAFDHPDVTPYVRKHMGIETTEQRGWRLSGEDRLDEAAEALTPHYGSTGIAEFCVAAHHGNVERARAAFDRLTPREAESRVGAEEGLRLARAHVVNGQEETGVDLLRMLIEVADLTTVGKARLMLGNLAEDGGDRSSALGWYRRAMGSPVVEVAAGGARRVARVLRELRDQPGAEQACRHAVKLAAGQESVKAGVLLGHLRAERGDDGGANEAWDGAEELADSVESCSAAFVELLRELADAGRQERSGPLAERASRIRSPDALVTGMSTLAEIARAEGADSRAVECYRRAAEVDGTPLAWNARLSLALLLADSGDAWAARAEFDRLSRSEEPIYAANGVLGIGLLLAESGDRIGAAAAFARALSYRVPEVDAAALDSLRQGLRQQNEDGEHVDAVTSLRLLADVADPDWAARRAFELGMALFESGETEQSLLYLRCSVELGGERPEPDALLALAEVLERIGDSDEVHALRARGGATGGRAAGIPSGADPAADSGASPAPSSESSEPGESFGGAEEPGVGPREPQLPAVTVGEPLPPVPANDYALAQSLRARGEMDAAREAYLRVIAAEDPHCSGEAVLELGSIGYESDDDDEAYRWYWRAAESGDPALVARAAMSIAMVAKRRGDLATARPWLLWLIDTGDGLAPLAAAHLAEMHYWRSEAAESVELYEYALANASEPELVAESAYRLGEFHYQAGDVPRATARLRLAAKTGHPGFSGEAVELLGKLGVD
ncbi:tetratricopeptide repeat protein [Parasphingorhabdus pacifica]